MSTRINPIDPAQAQGEAKALLDSVKARMGKAPNLLRVMANSPAVLEGYLGFSGALAKGALPPAIREQIALLVSQANGCEYCVSAHTFLGKHAGLAPDQLLAARQGTAQDAKAQAALSLAQHILERRGDVSDAQFAAARGAGLSDAAIAEVLGHVALAVFTNYFNQLARTEVDFPHVSLSLSR